jgi:hypothetical protein
MKADIAFIGWSPDQTVVRKNSWEQLFQQFVVWGSYGETIRDALNA